MTIIIKITINKTCVFNCVFKYVLQLQIYFIQNGCQDKGHRPLLQVIESINKSCTICSMNGTYRACSGSLSEAPALFSTAAASGGVKERFGKHRPELFKDRNLATHVPLKMLSAVVLSENQHTASLVAMFGMVARIVAALEPF